MQVIKVDKTAKINGSSVIDEVHYENTTARGGNLYVVFHNGTISSYRDVPPMIFEDFVGAFSVGSYYNRVIKNSYIGVHVDQDAVFEPRVTVSSPAPAVPAGAAKFRVEFSVTGSGNMEVSADDIKAAVEAAENLITHRLQGSGSNFDIVVKSVNPA